MAVQPGGRPALRALLIGIDCYLPNQIPGVGYYPSLHGCVRDIRHVEEFLLARGALPNCILKLTATNSGEQQPTEPPDDWPTYANMVAAFDRVTEVAQPGDQVYVHYSGHGGRAATQFPDLKGAGGRDETLVPTDIGNSEARYLRDVELAYILQKMVDKGLLVTLVLDSCHSGGATRAGLAAQTRGVGFVDTSLRPTGSLVADKREMAANWERLNRAASAGDPASGAGWLPDPRGYVLLAACRPSESAYEYAYENGETNGALTYWFLKALSSTGGPGLTYREVYNRLLGLIYTQFPDQTPMLLGEAARRVFGGDLTARGLQVSVLAVDIPKGRVRLATGEAQGIGAGARFALYPGSQEDFGRAGDRLAVATVTEAGATASWAELSELCAGPAEIEPGAQAVLLSPQTSVRVQRTAGFAPRRDLPGEVDQAAAFKSVTDALQAGSKGFIRLPALGEAPDYLVSINPAGRYEILDPSGVPLVLRPELPAGDPGSGASLVARLDHIARYRALFELANSDHLSSLAGKLELTLDGVQDNYVKGTRPDPRPFPTSDPGVPTARPGQWVFVRMANRSSGVLNVALLELTASWSIRQVFPTFEDFEPLDPGEERLAAVQIELPEDYPAGRTSFKAFGTIGPASFRWLEMPALDRPPAGRTTRPLPRAPLEELLAALAGGGRRAVRAAPMAGDEWVTADCLVHIAR